MAVSKSKKRHLARRALLQALYQWQLSQSSAHDIELYFFAHQDMKDVDRAYFSEVLKAVIAESEELDATIAPILDRKTTELTPVEHAVLYIGTFELTHRIDIPYRVVINEGVELAKQFGAEGSYKYINGVLDKLSYKLRKPERLK